MEYFTTKEILCGLGSGFLSSLVAVGLCYKLAPKVEIITQYKKYYSGNFYFTYSYKNNGIKDFIGSTIIGQVPTSAKIKFDEEGRVIPTDKGRFFKWAKHYINHHRHQVEIIIHTHIPIEDLKPDFVMTDPNLIQTQFVEHNQRIEQELGIENSALEIDLTEDNELVRSI